MAALLDAQQAIQFVVGVLLDRYELMEQECNRQVTDVHLAEIARAHCKEWRWLIPKLGMESIVESDIERDAISESEKRRKFFLKWKESTLTATYLKLITALVSLQMLEDAQNVCKLLKLSTTPVRPALVSLAVPLPISASGTRPDPEVNLPLDPEITENLVYQLRLNQERITSRYASFVSHVCDLILDKGVSPEHLRTYLLGLQAFTSASMHRHELLSSLRNELKGACTINEIIDLLNVECASYLNPEIFESILRHYNLPIPEDHEHLKYSDHLEAYIKMHKISEFIVINPDLERISNASKKMIFKFDIDNCRIVEIMNLKSIIARIFGLLPGAVQLLGVEEGCVTVTFVIPALVADILFAEGKSLTRVQVKALQVLSVVHLECDKFFFEVKQALVDQDRDRQEEEEVDNTAATGKVEKKEIPSELEEGEELLEPGKDNELSEAFCIHSARGCDWRGDKDSLDDHLLGSCELHVIECHYKFLGCMHKCLHKDMPQHLMEEAAYHMTLMQGDVTRKPDLSDSEMIHTPLTEGSKQRAWFMVLALTVAVVAICIGVILYLLHTPPKIVVASMDINGFIRYPLDKSSDSILWSPVTLHEQDYLEGLTVQLELISNSLFISFIWRTEPFPLQVSNASITVQILDKLGNSFEVKVIHVTFVQDEVEKMFLLNNTRGDLAESFMLRVVSADFDSNSVLPVHFSVCDFKSYFKKLYDLSAAKKDMMTMPFYSSTGYKFLIIIEPSSSLQTSWSPDRLSLTIYRMVSIFDPYLNEQFEGYVTIRIRKCATCRYQFVDRKITIQGKAGEKIQDYTVYSEFKLSKHIEQYGYHSGESNGVLVDFGENYRFDRYGYRSHNGAKDELIPLDIKQFIDHGCFIFDVLDIKYLADKQ